MGHIHPTSATTTIAPTIPTTTLVNRIHAPHRNLRLYLGPVSHHKSNLSPGKSGFRKVASLYCQGGEAKIMAIKAAIVALIACIFVPAQGWSQTHLSGTVRDSEGAVISGARIFIHWDRSGSDVGLTTNVGIKQDLTLTTDANGSFSAELPSGFYDVLVTATAFSPDCRKIRLNAGQTATFNAKLSVSLIVVKELPGPRVSAPK